MILCNVMCGYCVINVIQCDVISVIVSIILYSDHPFCVSSPKVASVMMKRNVLSASLVPVAASGQYVDCDCVM